MNKSILVALGLAFFMLLTRGSHVLTQVALPDASVALFLLGGLLLRRSVWFAALFVLGTVIDFGAAALDPAQGFCLSNGYWGLIPAYGAMWLAGMYLSKQEAFATKNLAAYGSVSMLATFVAFVISTQTYYLFSGRFPANGLVESLQHGWEYLPGWMGYSAMYFAMFWLAAFAVRQIKPQLAVQR